ncbi:MAG: UvrABC system protein [Planctomycetota bacterium]
MDAKEPGSRRSRGSKQSHAEPATHLPSSVSESSPAEMGTDQKGHESISICLPKEKIRKFPTSPGVYLMKDAQGRVVYVGKAKNLKARAGSYFQKTAENDARIRDWIGEVVDIDYLEAESEVDALLMEARLVKDIQPKHNAELKDDKTFPYLQITTSEDFPRVTFTRTPADRGVKLYGPFPRAKSLRGAIQVLQKIFKFRTCPLDIDEDDPRWRWFRPCLLASIDQCTAPCNQRIDKATYRKDIRRLILFLDGKKAALVKELTEEMKEASRELRFEAAARIRDELKAIESIALRGDLRTHAQPEVFYVDPRKGLRGLKKVLELTETPRRIDCVDIAHLGGSETVGSLVTFVDGLPFKPGYKRYKIQTVSGIDDFASIREVVSRRIESLKKRDEPLPDIFLIDGGKGQLSSAYSAFQDAGIEPPCLISLAKREEEIYRLGRSEPLVLSRHSFALRLLQAARDEAHRFAQHYHHLLRKKRTLGEE